MSLEITLSQPRFKWSMIPLNIQPCVRYFFSFHSKYSNFYMLTLTRSTLNFSQDLHQTQIHKIKMSFFDLILFQSTTKYVFNPYTTNSKNIVWVGITLSSYNSLPIWVLKQNNVAIAHLLFITILYFLLRNERIFENSRASLNIKIFVAMSERP